MDEGGQPGHPFFGSLYMGKQSKSTRPSHHLLEKNLDRNGEKQLPKLLTERFQVATKKQRV